MSNNSFLCCAQKKHTYPSFQEPTFKSAQQTVAEGSYVVPLMWLAIFRPKDLKTERFLATRVDGEGILSEPAPISHRRSIVGRLKDALPRLNKAFGKLGPLDGHAELLRTAIDKISDKYLVGFPVMCYFLDK